MADFGGVTNVSAGERTDNDTALATLKLHRDGALFTSAWTMGLAMEGRVYVGNLGTATGPATFSDSDTISTTEVDFDLLVPPGTVVLPLEIRVYNEAYGTALQFECMASTGTGGVQAAGTTVTPRNLRADAPHASVCDVRGATASGGTYMTANVAEFWRDGQQFAITKTDGAVALTAADPYIHIWRWSDALVPPILYSSTAESRLTVFASSQVGTGFITVIWAELPQQAIG